jgi:hypothetical protein
MARLIILQDILPRRSAAGPVVPRGGHSMFVLQWLSGLRKLGHDVLFINFTNEQVPTLLEAGRRYFKHVVQAWWDPSRAALLSATPLSSLAGLSMERVRLFARRADALLTLGISGQREPPEILRNIHPRVLIDTDPAYTQLWAALVGDAGSIFGDHDLYYTVGGNIGTDRCRVPTFGLDWITTWNPVVPEWWELAQPPEDAAFTTVADWWGEKYLEFEGQILGPKREEFLKFLAMPLTIGERIVMALDIPPNDPDIQKLESHGWCIRSPTLVEYPESYREWIATSAGEFSCAKGVYVGTHSGWFSDRSACYLAAGRPVIVQDTGISDVLPSDRGLIAVTTPDEAIAAIRAVRKDYAQHSKAAKAIAREFFSPSATLSVLLERAGLQ